jgi:hypothetical protein
MPSEQLSAKRRGRRGAIRWARGGVSWEDAEACKGALIDEFQDGRSMAATANRVLLKDPVLQGTLATFHESVLRECSGQLQAGPR